jgi:hypothetical protein
VSVNVHRMVNHAKFHQDELFGDVFLLVDGGAKFNGIANATFRFVSDPFSINADLLLKQGELCVGCGGGLFDEHNKGLDKCCADLVAEYLGIADRPAVHRILNEVRRADRTAHVLRFEMSTQMKDWHRLYPNAPMKVWNLAKHMPVDVYRYEDGCERHGTSKPTFTMADLARDLKRTFPGDFENNYGLKKLMTALLEADIRATIPAGVTDHPSGLQPLRFLEIFRIFFMWQELYSEANHGVVRGWALDILRDAATSAVRFQQAFDAYRPRTYSPYVYNEHIGKYVPIVFDFQVTDDPDVSKISRIKGADVTIVQNSRGNFAIFTNSKRHYGLDMQKVVGKLRMAEVIMRNNGRMPARYTDDPAFWEMSENAPGIPWWYYLKAGQMVLNGSDQSSSQVEASVLSMKQVAFIVWKNLGFLRLRRDRERAA